MWQNIIIRRDIAGAEIARGFARVFGVAPQGVAIVDDLLRHPDYQLPRDCQILVDRVRRDGEFAAELTVIIYGARAEAMAREKAVDALVGDLSAIWKTDILISGPDPSPYEWRLIAPSGGAQAVTLDAEQLDEDGHFVVIPASPVREVA